MDVHHERAECVLVTHLPKCHLRFPDFLNSCSDYLRKRTATEFVDDCRIICVSGYAFNFRGSALWLAVALLGLLRRFDKYNCGHSFVPDLRLLLMTAKLTNPLRHVSHKRVRRDATVPCSGGAAESFKQRTAEQAILNDLPVY